MIADAFHWSLTAPPWLLGAVLVAVAAGSVVLRRWSRG